MGIKRNTEVLPAKAFFHAGLPIYVNRAVETFEMAEHSHEFIEIAYVSEGTGFHYIDGRPVPAKQGTVFFIPIGCNHVFRPKTPQTDQPLIVYNCLFKRDFLIQLHSVFPQTSEITDAFLGPGTAWFGMKDTTGAYHALFRQLYHEFSARPPGYFAVLASVLIQILAALSRHQADQTAPPGQRTGWPSIQEAIHCIDRHYNSELRVRKLAEQANLSPRQFSRLFRRQTGMSYTEYLQSVRMDAACRLLQETGRNISEIAAAVGYSDLKFFHIVFKRKKGMTPLQYRQTYLRGE